MGYQSNLGAVKEFEQMQKEQKKAKRLAIRQFLSILKKYSRWQKNEQQTAIKWGQQIEGHFLQKNEEGQLELARGAVEQYQDMPFPMMNEYGSWMFETIPNEPYHTTCNLYQIVALNRQKYKDLKSRQKIPMTIPCVPLLGMPSSQNSRQTTFNNVTQSNYLDDSYITNFQRYHVMTGNINIRRQKKVEMKLPLFQDVKTNVQELKQTEPYEGFIHMDALVFANGCSCLQTTFSTLNLDHARYLYDQLNVLTPIFLALTAGTPFFKGKISDWDVRWNVLTHFNDDRNPQQSDPSSSDYIPTKRYVEALYYIWNDPANRAQYNDVSVGVRPQDIDLVASVARQKGIELDEKLLFHLAYQFRHDFLMIPQSFKDMSEEQFIAYEMMNGTNWNSVRLKPPINETIGWRVQFRPMEVQLTADQNSAFALISHLLTRLLHQNRSINLYMPMSLLRENFQRAHVIDAVSKQKFHFRTNIHDQGPPEMAELTAYEIIFGKGYYKGLFIEIEQTMAGCLAQCPNTVQIIECLKKFLKETALGQRKTLSRWQRDYVNNHPEYGRNSILGRQVVDDLLTTMLRIESGQISDPHFYKIFPDLDDSSLSVVPPHISEQCCL